MCCDIAASGDDDGVGILASKLDITLAQLHMRHTNQFQCSAMHKRIIRLLVRAHLECSWKRLNDAIGRVILEHFIATARFLRLCTTIPCPHEDIENGSIEIW